MGYTYKKPVPSPILKSMYKLVRIEEIQNWMLTIPIYKLQSLNVISKLSCECNYCDTDTLWKVLFKERMIVDLGRTLYFKDTVGTYCCLCDTMVIT